MHTNCTQLYLPECGDKLRLELLQQELLRQQRVPCIAKFGQHCLQQLQPQRPQCLHLCMQVVWDGLLCSKVPTGRLVRCCFSSS